MPSHMLLETIRVLDLSRLLPGPYCSWLLAQMGADVICVQPPGEREALEAMSAGSLNAGFHRALARGKRSIALDLKQPDGLEVLLRLVDHSDVLLESFRPGVMDRLGAGWDVLHDRRPELVMCSITGMGSDGPDADRPGHDLNYLGLSGALAATGVAPGELAIPGVQIADIGGGGQPACIAILAALLRRQQTGRGARCEVAMVDGLISWTAPLVAAAEHGGTGPAAGRDLLTGGYPCYALYACIDGQVTVAALEPKFWQRLVERLGAPELGGDQFAIGERGAAVRRRLAAVLATGTREHWRTHLSDCCVEPVLEVTEVAEHPQVRARGSLVHDGDGWASRLPFRIDGDAGPVLPTDQSGRDVTEILAVAGYDADTQTQLITRGIAR